MNQILNKLPIGQTGIALLFLLLSAYFLVVMEWAFFVSKPSFFSSFTTRALFEALFIVSLECFVLSAFLLVLISVIASGVSLADRTMGEKFSSILHIPSALLWAFSAILLLDNFTNTLFGYGIAKAQSIFRGGYLLFFLYVFYRAFNILSTISKSTIWHDNSKRLFIVSCAIVSLSLIFAALGVIAGLKVESSRGMDMKGTNVKGLDGARDPGSELPNILFFASDGISAGLLSAYGNKNKTTPNLDLFISKALIAKNTFTNAERTTGSVTSMLTGKYPATIKVLFPPHLLQGVDAHQHLPGILKRLGYSSFQESVRYYADANDLNFLNGFESANGIESEALINPFRLPVQHATLLANKITERIGQRLRHIFFIDPMPDVYAAVKSDGYAKVYGFSDRSRIDRALEFIQNNDGPLFMHLHLMDSHCCKYKPKEKVFSAGEFPVAKAKKRALLEDVLKESDGYFGELVDALRGSGMLDNTIIVYSSDHAENWEFGRPVPLIFIFPGGDHSGTIMENTQLLDVAPTILDYLDIERPEWMEGQSLLSDTLDKNRPIFGITQLRRGHFKTQKKDRLSRIVGDGPPNYGLKIMGLVVCNRWYLHNLKNDTTKSGNVPDYSGSCDASSSPNEDAAKTIMREHLLSKGFLGS